MKKTIKTITFSLPVEMSKDIEKMAKEEHRTISEFLRETIRQYRAKKVLRSISKKGRAAVKKKGLTPKDFGGPFEN